MNNEPNNMVPTNDNAVNPNPQPVPETVTSNTEVLEPVTETPQFEEATPQFQEVTINKLPERTDSYFDGGLLELVGWYILTFLLTGITLGIGRPWAKCMLYNYQFKHTVYNGKRLKFEGTGGDLFVNYFKWIFLSIVTFGIYAFVVPVRKAQWVISNLHFEDENLIKGESYFDGKTLQLIGVNILCNILNIISFGLLYAFTVCFKLKWINKHTVINRKKLAFTGKALNLFGKYLLWIFLTLITFGIYGWWLRIKLLKWETKNVHIKVVGEQEVEDNKALAVAIAVGVIGLLLFIFIVPRLITGISNIDLPNGNGFRLPFGGKSEVVGNTVVPEPSKSNYYNHYNN